MQNTWDVSIQRGWIIGLALIAVLLAMTVGLAVYAVSSPISIWLFLMSVLAVMTLGLAIRLSYQLWGLISASYIMDRNAVVIHWGGVEHIVPMAEVREVMSGSSLEALRIQPGLRWPGCFIGIGKANGIETILFYATQAPQKQVVLRTDSMAYAISPIDVDTFLPALRERLEMGPTQEVAERSTHPPFLDWDIWHDPWALGLLSGACALLIILVGVM
ncbi:MAG: PH domain-containing protein [Anaerolineae bacterium]|nr:PH domain-containing protein [Anaerolineae bacterium]